MAVKHARNILALKHRKAREAERKYLIEGVRLCEEALRSNAPVEQMVFCRDTVNGNERLQRLLGNAEERGVFVQQTDRRAMRGMCDTQTPQGVLGVVEMPAWDRRRVLASPSPVLLLDRVRDPGNLGLMMRTAEAAGAGALVLSRGCVEIYNPKVVRASMGAIYRLPVFSDETLADVVKDLRLQGRFTLAAHMDGVPFHQLTEKGPVALLLGNEAFGIEPALAALADARISIPMAEPVESLNVAVAAGILLYKLAEV